MTEGNTGQTHLFFPATTMPSKKSAGLMFQSVIRTRERNKNVHPREPDQVTKRRSQAEMQEIKTQRIEEQKLEEDRQSKALAHAAYVEDKLRHNDSKRQIFAEQPKAPAPAFQPEHTEQNQG
jgi:hypothetical protein